METAGHLCELGWDVAVVAADVPQQEIDERVRVTLLPRPRIYLAGYVIFHVLLVCRLLLAEARPDIILLNQESGLFVLPTVRLRRLLGRETPRIVMDSRSLPMHTATVRERARALAFRIAQSAANCLADGQTAITWRLAQALKIPRQRLLGVWPSGVNIEQLQAAIFRRQWPRPEEPLRLIYIGSLLVERNLLALCEAVCTARAEGLAVSLDLVGEGLQRPELEEYARAHGHGGICVRAAVRRSEVTNLLARAHVGVLPFPDTIEFQVSSPIKLFEYMAAGMPILATRVVCHTDVCRDGKYVFWAEDSTPAALTAAIRAACACRANLNHMGQRAFAAVQDWTWEESAKQLDAALRRGLDGVAIFAAAAARGMTR